MKKAVVSALLLSLSMSFPVWAGPTPDEALSQLKQGNERYISGKSAHPRIDPQRRRDLADEGQFPIAAILGCADARVPPELVFDQKFGNLFVVRVAGNVCGDLELASLEYAVAKLHTPLIVVLGHSQCGAVQAAIEQPQGLTKSLQRLIGMIEPAVAAARQKHGDSKQLLFEATTENVLNNVKAITGKSEIIRSAVEKKSVKVVGAVREIREGHVQWLVVCDSSPKPASK